MEINFLEMVVANIPNFIGFAVALYLMREQNRALLELLRQCNERKEPEPTETS